MIYRLDTIESLTDLRNIDQDQVNKSVKIMQNNNDSHYSTPISQITTPFQLTSHSQAPRESQESQDHHHYHHVHLPTHVQAQAPINHPSSWSNEELLTHHNFPSFESLMLHHNLHPSNRSHRDHAQEILHSLRMQACRAWNLNGHHQQHLDSPQPALHTHNYTRSQSESRSHVREQMKRKDEGDEEVIDPRLRSTANNDPLLQGQTGGAGDVKAQMYNSMIREREPMRIAAMQSRELFQYGMRVRDESEMFWESYNRLMENSGSEMGGRDSRGGDSGVFRKFRGSGRDRMERSR